MQTLKNEQDIHTPSRDSGRIEERFGVCPEEHKIGWVGVAFAAPGVGNAETDAKLPLG